MKECTMSAIPVMLDLMEMCRTRTLTTLDDISKLPDPKSVLGWRPGPGRAHIGWQLTHIGIVEELTGSERMGAGAAAFPDLVPRFKFGSVPDDDIPSIELIRQVLSESRQHVCEVFAKLSDADLETIPAWYKDRGWNIRRILQILAWHEAHHQGQAHITLNLWKGTQPKV
jgi:hypothetical protein